MVLVWSLLFLACSGTPASAPTVSPVPVMAAPVEIRVAGQEDLGGAMNQLRQVQRGVNREAGAVLVLAAGTYTRNLQIHMPDLPMDLTIRGEGEVWFEGAVISISGRSLSVAGIGFRGQKSSGVFLSVDAVGEVTVTDVRVHGAQLGTKYTPYRPPVPAKPGGQRIQARGAKPRPSYLVQIKTRGEGAVFLKNLDFRDTRLIGHALVDVHSRPGREVVVEGLSVVDTPTEQAVRVSVGSTLVTR